MPEIAEVRAAKQGRNEETAADPQGSQAITQIHSGGGSRARKNHIGMY